MSTLSQQQEKLAAAANRQGRLAYAGV